MRLILIIPVLLLLVTGCGKDSEKWKIVPGKSAGPINENTSEQDLISVFGKDNVKRKKIHIGEGLFLNGHILFEDQKNECELLWIEGLKPPVERLIFTKPNSSWHLENGLSVGSTLEEINELNGRPFRFYGFAWDMGGLVISWENGNMASIADDSLVIFLSPKDPEDIPNEVIGDKEISSDNQGLIDLNIRVSRIEVLLQSSQPSNGIIIAKSGLVLRDSPNLEGLRQVSIPYEAEVEILDLHGPMATIDDMTAHWLKVRYKQYEGWVFGGYVDVIK